MTADELYEKYKQDLKELQDNCKHENISDWLTYYWAPAHSNGEVKQCIICQKILERRNDMSSLQFTQTTN